MSLFLDDFRYVIGYHPYHFWQLSNAKVPVTSSCNSVVYEHKWQDTDAVGRVSIRESINRAEDILYDHLGFSVGVRYIEEEIQFPKLKNVNLSRYANVDARGRRIAVKASGGEIIAAGKESHLAIDLNAPVILSDEFPGGLTDTFTLTVNIAGLDVSEDDIAVYFITSDRLDNEPISEKWEVGPVTVSISGDVATITGRSWLIVKPILYQGVVPATIDPSDANSYAENLAVFKRYANPDGTTINNSQAVLIWESFSGSGCDSLPGFATCCDGLSLDGGYTDPHAQGYAVSRVGLRDKKLGWVTTGESVLGSDGLWQEISWSGCRQPDKVLLRYKAGVPYRDNTILGNRSSWKLITSRLAAAELMNPICACDMANQELYRWQFDVSRSAGANDEQYQISQEDLNNPLGLTSRGAIYAWKQIKNLKQTMAYLP